MKLIMFEDSKYKEEYLKEYLKEEVIVFDNFNDGMRELMFSENNYDALILDMNFPLYKNEVVEPRIGFAVLRELKKKQKNIPVIIYSSYVYDVSEFDNIIGYIHYDPTSSMKNQIEEIKLKIKKKI